MVDYNVTNGLSLICDMCKKNFESEIDLINHCLNHSIDPYFCNKCGKNFYFETELSDHLKCHKKVKDFVEKDDYSQSRNPFMLSKCKEEMINKYETATHRGALAEPSSSCDSSVGSAVMDVHNESVLKKEFVCDVCEDHFADEQDLLNHTSHQHPEQSLHECVVCNEKFSNKQELVHHGQEHLLEEPSMYNTEIVMYNEQYHGYTVIDDREEETLKRRCVRVRKLFESAEESNQNTSRHAGNTQKSTMNSRNNQTTDGNNLGYLSENDSHDLFIISQSDAINLGLKRANTHNSDHPETHYIAFNHETNEFEVFVSTDDGTKVSISSEFLHAENEGKVYISNKESKSAEVAVNNEHVKHYKENKAERLSLKNRIHNEKTVGSSNESVKRVEKRKNYNVQTYLEAEDTNDISGIVAVVYDEDSNSVLTTYEVCEVEVDDTSCKSSSIQNSKTVILQNDSANEDEKAVDTIKKDLYDHKILKNFQEHNAQDRGLPSSSVTKKIRTMKGDILLTNATEIEEQTLTDLLDRQLIPENTIIKHVSPCTKIKSHICHICKKSYSSKLALDRHIYLHSGVKPFACNMCDRRFPRKYDLKDHMLVHGDKPYACPVCGKCFARESYVDKHVVIHSGERPFLCDVCGKNFTRKQYLITHRLNHVDNNPFMCSTCDQCFSERHELDAHRETHSFNVSYVCVVCKKTFSQRRHLERHILLHTGEKPFSCEMCDRRFSRKDALLSHSRSHSHHSKTKKVQSVIAAIEQE